MPLLKHRWPAAAQTIARSAEHCAEAEELLQEHTARDYQQVHEGHELLIDRLHELSPARQRQVIRFWLSEQQLPLPSTAQLQQIQTEVLASREDAEPLVHWSGVNIQRYRGRLYANKDQTKLDLTNVKLPWDLSQPLILPGNLGTLTAQLIEGEGISANRLAATPITIQFRRGGERCRPATRSHSQTLKNLFQEYAIPTWQRDQIPLLYCGDEIAAVLGQWICLNYSAKADEQGWVINWN
jgi:tRNA(Ile)-lysidine synthase